MRQLVIFGVVASAVLYPFMIAASIDGGTALGHFTWLYTLGASGEPPGIAGTICLIWIACLLAILIAIRTSWWERESREWLPVGALLIYGCREKSATHRQTQGAARRFGLVVGLIGLGFLASEAFEFHILRSVKGAISVDCNTLCLSTVVVGGLTAVVIILIGMLLPQLVRRPTVLFSLSLLASLLGLSAFVLEVVEHEVLIKLFRERDNVGIYSESIAAIWVTALAFLAYFLTGGLFGLRQYLDYRDEARFNH